MNEGQSTAVPHATSPILAHGLVETAREIGVTHDVWAPMEDALEIGGDAWLAPEIEDGYWRAAAEVTSLRDLGATAPMAAPRGAFGVVELAASTAPTVREALDVLASSSDVLHETRVFELVPRDDLAATLVYRSAHERDTPGGGMAAETALTSTVELVRRITNERDVAPTCAWLVGRPHARLATLRRALGCDVRVGAALDRLDIDREVLDLQTRTADARLHRLAKRLVVLEREARASESTVFAVRDVLRDAVLDPTPPLEAVARRLELAPRTVQDRLARERVRIRRLVDEARASAADRLLLAGVPAEQVRRCFGYADLGSLGRACRRWWGQSLSERRARLVGAGAEVALRMREMSSARDARKR